MAKKAARVENTKAGHALFSEISRLPTSKPSSSGYVVVYGKSHFGTRGGVQPGVAVRTLPGSLGR